MATITERNVTTGEVISRELTPEELSNSSAPTQADTIAVISREITSILDQGAKAWGYDSIVSAASYASSANAQYVADAKALIGWRDSVWSWAIPLFPSVTIGEDHAVFLANIPKQHHNP